MERWKGRVALVTGASMGIGESICCLLISHGMKVVACARSDDKLKGDYGRALNFASLSPNLHPTYCVYYALGSSLSNPEQLLPVRCDLRKQSEIMKMFDVIKGHWGGVDVCINNAGLALGPSIIEGDSEEWENMWQVNVMALCLCTRASVKSMRERGVDDGHIINMNSLSGQRVGKSHFYSATKYAVTALTEGIRWELRGIESHIRISSISPGLVQSHFHAIQIGEEAAQQIYDTKQCLQPKDIASIVEYILASPPHVQIHEVMVRPTEQVV